jgi:dTDP-4-dehydrorhamnose 3,5-epimerase-like enzyme
MNHKEIVNGNNTGPMLINGGTFVDKRGILSFVNDFDFKGVKRFYTVENLDTEQIRAWQGHRYERKYFYVIRGSFRISLIKNENWIDPDQNAVCKSYDLHAANPQILYIPGGYLNGFKALEIGSILLVYSDCDLIDSLADDYRWDLRYFNCWDKVF